MPNNDLPQRMYTPLSQNMTDSDSEEDLHQPQHHQMKKQSTAALTVNSNGTRRMLSNNHAASTVLGPLHEVNSTNYTNLNSDGEERHHNDADNIRILGSGSLKATKPMSTIRRILFILSLLLCVIIVVLFLWVIPCSDEANCPARIERVKTHNWIRNYEKIELKGTINVVNGLHGRSKNLVFMYRGDKLFNEFENVNPKRNGIISLIGSSGQVGWYDEIVNEPKIIDCTLIDVDKNGSPDCLVVDEFGEIGCINPMSGEWLWHISDRTTKTAEFLSFPLILPDLNRDGVNELLVVASVGQGNYNNLKLISGATGQTIGATFPVNECSYIHKFQLDKRYKVRYNCINNDTEIQIVKPLSELYRLITNKSVDLGIGATGKGTTFAYPPISQHKYYGQRKDTLSQRNIYSVSGKQLIVENNGKCPDSCNVSVQLIEQKNGKDHIIGHISGSRMYGMVPASLSFNNTGVHGFVLKFWEWSLNETDFHFQTRNRRSTFTSTEYNHFSDVLTKKRSWQFPHASGHVVKMPFKRSTRNDPSNSGDPLKSLTRFIKETVVLIVFNSTDIRIDNTSQSNIIQFCVTENDEQSSVSCQPDLNYQENSLLIADLDEDGSQELVSYYTTFVQHDDEKSWRLVTFVQLLRLESELPKLYSNVLVADRK